MASTATTRLRLEKQGTGENNNAWGSKLNTTALDLIDTAIAGRSTFTLSGTKTLSSTNYAADESRAMFLDITSGTGGTVTIPSVEKVYFVRNATSGSVIVTTGSGTTATLLTGTITAVMCDATNVYAVNSPYGGWTTIATQATTSGSTITFSGIAATYQDLLFELRGVVASASTALRIAVSPDGSTWSGAASTGASLTATSTYYGDCSIENYMGQAGAAVMRVQAGLADNEIGSNQLGYCCPWRVSAGIAAVRFSVSSGAFTAGSIVLKART